MEDLQNSIRSSLSMLLFDVKDGRRIKRQGMSGRKSMPPDWVYAPKCADGSKHGRKQNAHPGEV